MPRGPSAPSSNGKGRLTLLPRPLPMPEVEVDMKVDVLAYMKKLFTSTASEGSRTSDPRELSPDNSTIMWFSCGKTLGDSQVPLSSTVALKLGQHTSRGTKCLSWSGRPFLSSTATAQGLLL
jgi:hypothetical protein